MALAEPDAAAGRRRRRIVIALAVVLALLEITYLLVGNSFLRGDWGAAAVNRKPEKFNATWEGGWTVLPGLLHVRGLHLRGQTRRARWSAHVDSGTLQVAVPALVGRHFRVHGAGARGVEVAVDVLPKPDAPRPPRKSKRGWRVTLDDIALSQIRSLRVGDLHLQTPGSQGGAESGTAAGSGSGHGSVFFEIRGPMRLDLDHLRVSGATLLAFDHTGEPDAHGEQAAGPGSLHRTRLPPGAEVVARDVDFGLDFAVDRFVASQQDRRDFLAAARSDLEVGARVESLAFLDPWLSTVPWLALRGRGDLAGRVTLASGALSPGSHLSLTGSELSADFFDFRALGAGRLEASVPAPGGKGVEGEAGEPPFDLALHLGRYRVERLQDGADLLEGEELELAVALPSASFLDRKPGASGSIHLPAARVTSFAALGSYLPIAAGVRLTAGTGTLSSQLSFDATPDCSQRAAGCGSGWLKLDGNGVAGSYGDAGFVTDLSLDAELPAADLAAGRINAGGSRLELSATSVRRRGEVRSSGWWARLELPTAAVLAGEGGGPAVERVDAHIRGSARDAVPFVLLMEQRFPKLRWFDQFVSVPGVAVDARLVAAGSELRIRDAEVTGGEDDHLQILAEIDVDGPDTRGALFARYRALHAALVLDQGEKDWKILGARRAYDRAVEDFRAGREMGD